MCTCRDRVAVDVKVGTQCSGLGEDVGDLTFELVVKDRAAEAELVLCVCCASSTPKAAKKRLCCFSCLVFVV